MFNLVNYTIKINPLTLITNLNWMIPPILEPGKHRVFQQLIGVALWVQSINRIDITYVVASLSRFSAQPSKGHLGLMRNMFGYLKKFPDKTIIIEPQYNKDRGELVKPPEGHESFNQPYPD